MHEKLVPHKGQGKGCPKFHFEGELDPATGKGCDGTKCPPGRDSHVCPLKACNHAKHSFKVFHPDLTWQGTCKTVGGSDPKVEKGEKKKD